MALYLYYLQINSFVSVIKHATSRTAYRRPMISNTCSRNTTGADHSILPISTQCINSVQIMPVCMCYLCSPVPVHFANAPR